MLRYEPTNPLFICDLANNHFGDLVHAKQIINELSIVAQETKVQLSVKFQFRNLESYIHKDFKERTDLKFINRFMSTKLEKSDFQNLALHIKSKKLVTMATPFDEDGVDWCRDLEIEIIKIASASSNDYSLIDRIAKAGKPVVASTAGLKSDEIDNLVFRLYEKVPRLTLMHCVAIYPCDDSALNLNQIRLFQKRYPSIGIGFSTHERPDSLIPVTIATALGAVALERHVGIVNKNYTLNDYSSQPNQIREWIESSKRTLEILGPENRAPTPIIESETLNDLKRGIFAKVRIPKGGKIEHGNTYLAFPLLWREGQLHAGMLENSLIASQDIEAHDQIGLSNSVESEKTTDVVLRSAVLQLRGLLAEAKVEINPEAQIEVSHHYGLERFREFGTILITCYNDEYAKKIVVQLPRQKHPYHFHKEKQETFQLLWGDMELTVNGNSHILKPGELFTVNRGEWHKFHSLHGAVVEEISTRAILGDSFYEDPSIARKSHTERKTKIPNWLNT